MQRSALITNLFLISRAGSELHALELARGMVRRGWRVTCFALLVGEPMRSRFLELGDSVRLLELGQEALLDERYDLLIAQHHIVSDYVYANLGITFEHAVVSVLGPLDGNELLPDFVDRCDCVSFVSEETLAAREADLAALRHRPPTYVFPNYATPDYLDFAPRDLPPERPRRVAVISNHVPPEVRGLQGPLARQGVTLDCFGVEMRSVDVTPELLGSYDAVVTIGRTVQQCLACGTPVFCYDQFGGPGYITRANAMEHAETNYSGRSHPVRRSADELALELLGEGYARAVADRGALRDLACREFGFDRLLDGLLELALRPKAPHEESAAVATAARVEKNRLLATYYRDVIDLNAHGAAQLFYGRDESDVDASRSFFVRYQYDCDITISLSEIPAPYRLVRFDPDDSACVCQLSTEGLVPARPCEQTDDGTLFVVDDPFYAVPEALDTQEIVFRAKPVPRSELLERQQGRVTQLESELDHAGALRRIASRIFGAGR